MLRGLVFAVIWLALQQLFEYIRHQGGSADISGHCFRFIWSIYYVIEESHLLKHLIAEEQSEDPWSCLNWGLQLFFGLNAGLVVFWDLFLLATMVFYHTLAEKVAAVVLALSLWIVTYQMIFVCLEPWCQLPRKVRQTPDLDRPRIWEHNYIFF